MKPPDLEHPAVKEMISRRSNGNPNYIAGVRAYLEQGKEPSQGTIAHHGYMDAHDMTEYLAMILADVRAEGFAEDAKIPERQMLRRRDSFSACKALTEVSKPLVQGRQNQGIRI